MWYFLCAAAPRRTARRSAGRGGPARTANATALAARGRRDARRDARRPAPGGRARAVLQSRDDFPLYYGTASCRPRLPDEEQARGARGVRGLGRGASASATPPPLGGHARRQAVVVPPGADGGHRQGRGPRQCGALVPSSTSGPTSTRDGQRTPALRDAVEQGPLAGQHQFAALRQGCGQPRLGPARWRAERPDLFDAYCPHVNGCAAGPGPGATPPASASSPNVRRRRPARATRRCGARSGRPKNGGGLRRASQIRVLEISLASAGAFTGSYSRTEWIVAARGRRLLWAAARTASYFRSRSGPHAPRRRRVLRAVSD